MKRLVFDFEVKNKNGKNITIEGFANPNTVDRAKERIDPKGWNLDNYKKNPVVLFDHGHDPAFGFLPIGKTTVIEARDDGLYTKILLSNSQTEKITAVRDLVEEGILKTFSVGFDPQEDTKDGDTMIITKAELIETSIVPIPMNQDSTFSLAAKRLGSGVSPLAARWFLSFAKKATLIKEKKFLAALLVQRIADLQEKGDFDLKKVVDYVAAAGAIKASVVEDIISGKVIGPSPVVLKALSETLKIELKLLTSVGQIGLAALEKAREEVKMDPKEDPKKPCDNSKAAGDQTMVVQSIAVPKEMFADAESAAGMVEQHGYKADKMTESETDWVFEQLSPDECNAAAGVKVDLGQGVLAMVCPPKAAASEAPVETPKDADPAMEEEPKKKAALPSGDAATPPDDNPYLEHMKTTNTMLGTLIEEVKKLGQILLNSQAEDVNEDLTSEDDQMKGLMSQIRTAHSSTGERLKRLGL